MKANKRILAAVTALSLFALLFSACGGQAADSTAAPSESQTEAAGSASAEAGTAEASPEASADQAELLGGVIKAPGQDTWLTEEKATLTMVSSMQSDLKTLVDTMDDLRTFQAAEDYTNVSIKITELSDMQTGLNLIIASGDYPDIWQQLGTVEGGLAKAYEDELLIDLKPYMDTCAPNYMGLLQSDEDMYKNAVDDNGNMYSFYGLTHEYKSVSGYLLRKDLLDGVNLDIPVTYEDYTEMGRAFLTEYGITDPIFVTSTATWFSEGYGTSAFNLGSQSNASHIYQDNGVIKSALIEDGYRKYIEQLRSWVEEGIVYRDIFEHGETNMDAANEAVILNGQAGAFLGHALNVSAFPERATVEGYELVGVNPPVENAGDVSHFSTSRSKVQATNNMQVSASCENPELAIRWMDFWFSTEGYYLNVFGPYGETYTIDENGDVQYTDLVLNNPDGLTPQVARNLYAGKTAALGSQIGVFLFYSDKDYAAIETWAEGTDDAGLLPSTLSLTSEEGSEISSILSDLETYAAETVSAFIVGEKPLSDWDSFTAQCKQMGIERVIELYQNALDRYNSR